MQPPQMMTQYLNQSFDKSHNTISYPNSTYFGNSKPLKVTIKNTRQNTVTVMGASQNNYTEQKKANNVSHKLLYMSQERPLLN
jgi:hypothetical protein